MVLVGFFISPFLCSAFTFVSFPPPDELALYDSPAEYALLVRSPKVPFHPIDPVYRHIPFFSVSRCPRLFLTSFSSAFARPDAYFFRYAQCFFFVLSFFPKMIPCQLKELLSPGPLSCDWCSGSFAKHHHTVPKSRPRCISPSLSPSLCPKNLLYSATSMLTNLPFFGTVPP